MPPHDEEKTEAPTPRRRQQARGKGQIPKSQEINAAVSLLAGLLLLGWKGERIGSYLIGVVRESLTFEGAVTEDKVVAFSAGVAVEVFFLLAPIFLILFIIILLTVWAQIGWHFSFERLKPNFDKLNLLAGLRRLFSASSAVMLLTNVGKLLIVGAVFHWTLSSHRHAILSASSLSFEHLFIAAARLVYQLGLRVGAVLLVLAIFDYFYQRHRHEHQLKMSKQEIKEELKNMEGDPLIKMRRRKVQMELMKQRLERDVPAADMVITNPTHVAIALKYEADSMPAPKVLAKGEDEIALHLREVALRCGVPVVERRSLARAMYGEVEVGDYIPEKFYRAVAEVLAYVYRLRDKKLRAS